MIALRHCALRNPVVPFSRKEDFMEAFWNNRTILGLSFLALTQVALSAEDRGSYVKCESLDPSAQFTIEFIGHPVRDRVETVIFRNRDGEESLRWNGNINGVARRGFIKISQTHKATGPFTRSTTMIFGMEDNVGINQPFKAIYRESVSTPWTPTVHVATYKLSCVSPF
jgi:hypothetical protein